jgi:hypothetical protein
MRRTHPSLFVHTNGGKVKVGICERFWVFVHEIFRVGRLAKLFEAGLGKRGNVPTHVEGQDGGYTLPAQSPPA